MLRGCSPHRKPDPWNLQSWVSILSMEPLEAKGSSVREQCSVRFPPEGALQEHSCWTFCGGLMFYPEQKERRQWDLFLYGLLTNCYKEWAYTVTENQKLWYMAQTPQQGSRQEECKHTLNSRDTGRAQGRLRGWTKNSGEDMAEKQSLGPVCQRRKERKQS